MSRLRSILVLLVVLACTSANQQVKAATVLAMDLASLVSAADYVLLANAQSEHSRYRKQDKLIVTDTTLRVISAWKGSAKAGDTLVATHLGGSVGDLGLNVPGEASFAIGKSAFVFLRHAKQSQDLYVVGMSQGVMPIEGEGDNARVLQSGSGAELVQRDADGKLVNAAPALTQPMPLRDMISELARLCAQNHAR